RPASCVTPVFRVYVFLTDDGINERGRVKRGQIVRPFAQADQLDRHAELALDGDDDAALGRPVELGQHDAGDVDHLREDPGLAQPVLPGGGVQYQQHLVHRGLLLHHALDLAQLVHEADLGVQAAGGVDDDGVDPGVDALGHGLEGHAGRVGALAV